MWYEATTLGGVYQRKKNNTMSYKQYINEFGILEEDYQSNNLAGWALSEEPTSLKELSKEYPDAVHWAIGAYMQQVSYHAQLNVRKYKA